MKPETGLRGEQMGMWKQMEKSRFVRVRESEYHMVRDHGWICVWV